MFNSPLMYDVVTMFYIIGLGNPGKKYANTRHNVGRMMLQDGVSENDWTKNKNANALCANATIGGVSVEYLLPETFMNRSGETVQHVAKYHEASPREFLVLHDDIDLPFGEIKISQGRGAGGNNGVQSVIDHLKSKDFIRIRIGVAPTSFWTGKIKRPSGGGPLEQFVLKPFSKKEQSQLPEVFKKVQEAIEVVIQRGVEKAMNQCN